RARPREVLPEALLLGSEIRGAGRQAPPGAPGVARPGPGPGSRDPAGGRRLGRLMVGVRGLGDGIAADSSNCYLGGDRGILSYRGIDIHELAAKSTFEEVCHLLWVGRLPRRDELEATRAALGRERAVPREILSLLATLARTSTPMDALRTSVSALAD